MNKVDCDQDFAR